MPLKRILLVEDSPNDVALTLAAFEQTNLANEVDVVSDGPARSLAPPDLYGQLALRGVLGEQAVNSFLANRESVTA